MASGDDLPRGNRECAMTVSGCGGSMQSEMNVTPMIDVLLVLLIVFMLIVPSVPRGESALAPKPAAQGRAAPADTVVLEVLKGLRGEPVFQINKELVARRDLQSRLAAIFAKRADRVLLVKGDDRLSFTEVAEAIDIGHAAGTDRVGIITPDAKSGL